MLIISEPQIDAAMDWTSLVGQMEACHRLAKPTLDDMLLRQGPNSMLVRAAWIDGLGQAIKAMTVFPGNTALPTIQGQVIIYDKGDGRVLASINGAGETRWKTAGDSALGSKLLSREDSRTLVMVGAGTMAEPLVRAHVAVRPSLERIVLWNRSAPRAEGLKRRLGDLGRNVEIETDLPTAIGRADIVAAATMAIEPFIRGAWLKPGTHLDLIGAYRPDMREVDDDAIRRARLFVDYRGTTIRHIGELMIPIATGVIEESDVLGDLYDLCTGASGRHDPSDITLFKNGGGAHLDLMTGLAIIAGMNAGNARELDRSGTRA